MLFGKGNGYVLLFFKVRVLDIFVAEGLLMQGHVVKGLKVRGELRVFQQLLGTGL